MKFGRDVIAMVVFFVTVITCSPMAQADDCSYCVCKSKDTENSCQQCCSAAQEQESADTFSAQSNRSTNSVEQSTGTPKIIERELTPDTGEYMKTPCFKTERYCTEWLPDGKCKLWDSREVQVPC